MEKARSDERAFASVIYSHAGASSGFVPMPYVSGRAGPGDFVAGSSAWRREEVLILLQQERTHRVAHASQCLAGGQSCNPVICGQMSRDFFHDCS